MPTAHDSAPLRWGILATGMIAGKFARGVAASHTGRVVAVGSREAASARAFAEQHGVPRAHATYEALLADPEVEAVYISTPHPLHREWAVRAAQAGKHVLCEKPAGMDRAEAAVMIAAAREAGVLFMEAFMYRCHPQTAKMRELVRDGALGRVGLVQATFGFNRPYDPASRTWARSLGGGGILDVGCYPVSYARLVAGVIDGRPFANPVSVCGAAHLHPQEGVDVYAAATLGFANGLIAQASCGVGLAQGSVARIYGSEGWLEVASPFVANIDAGPAELVLHRTGCDAEVITVRSRPLYAMEADAFAEALRAGLREVPAMTPDDTLGNMETLDRWRAAVGLTY